MSKGKTVCCSLESDICLVFWGKNEKINIFDGGCSGLIGL
jgi:hypothetical protein